MARPSVSGLQAYRGNARAFRSLLRMAMTMLCANTMVTSLGWVTRSYEQNRFAKMAAGLQMDPGMSGWLMGFCLLLILQIGLAGVLVWWRLRAALLLTALLPLSLLVVSLASVHDKPGSWTPLLVFLSLVWLAMTVLFATIGWRAPDPWNREHEMESQPTPRQSLGR